jgi:hypothetical protein
MAKKESDWEKELEEVEASEEYRANERYGKEVEKVNHALERLKKRVEDLGGKKGKVDEEVRKSFGHVLQKKEREVYDLLRKGELEESTKAMKELKEGYERAPKKLEYGSGLLDSHEVDLLGELIGLLVTGKATPYEVLKHIDKFGDAIAGLYQTAAIKGIHCCGEVHPQSDEIKKVIEVYKQFLQNNNAPKMIKMGIMSSLLGIGISLGQEKLYKTMRIVAEYQGPEASSLPEWFSNISRGKPERFDKAVDILEKYGARVVKELADFGGYEGLGVELVRSKEFADAVGRFEGEDREAAINELVFIAVHYPQSFDEAVKLITSDKSIECIGRFRGEDRRRMFDSLGSIATHKPESFGKAVDVIESFGEAGELVSISLGHHAYQIYDRERHTTEKHPEIFDQAVKLLGSGGAVECIGRFEGKAKAEVVSRLGDIAVNHPENFGQAVKLLGSDKAVEVIGKFGDAEIEVVRYLSDIAVKNSWNFDKIVELIGSDEAVDAIGRLKGNAKARAFNNLASIATYNPPSFDKAVEVVGKFGEAGSPIAQGLHDLAYDIYEKHAKPSESFDQAVQLIGSDKFVKVVERFGEAGSPVAYNLLEIAVDKPESFDQAVRLITSDKSVECIGRFEGKAKAEVAWWLGWATREKLESFDKVVELMGSKKAVDAIGRLKDEAKSGVIERLVKTATYNPENFDKELKELSEK